MSGLMLKRYTAGLDAGSEINAGLDAGPIQKVCGAGSVPGPGFGEDLTFLMCIFEQQGIITYNQPFHERTTKTRLC